MGKYSIYVFVDERDRPYYVGKTNNFNRRKKEHLKEIEKGNTLPKYNKARKLIKAGFYLKMSTIKRTDNEDKAYRLEREYIKKYRKEGYQLLNCTYGGPHEIPMRINKPKKLKQVGIKLPIGSKAKLKKRSKAISRHNLRGYKR